MFASCYRGFAQFLVSSHSIYFSLLLIAQYKANNIENLSLPLENSHARVPTSFSSDLQIHELLLVKARTRDVLRKLHKECRQLHFYVLFNFANKRSRSVHSSRGLLLYSFLDSLNLSHRFIKKKNRCSVYRTVFFYTFLISF